MSKKPLNVILLSIAMLALTQPSTAQEEKVEHDGNYLLKNCIQAIRSLDGDNLDPIQGMRSTFCLGYINGFLGSHMLSVSLAGSQPLFCTPKDGVKRGGVLVGQVARIIVKWFKSHPEKLHLDADMLTLIAIRTAFPCETDDPERMQP